MFVFFYFTDDFQSIFHYSFDKPKIHNLQRLTYFKAAAPAKIKNPRNLPFQMSWFFDETLPLCLLMYAPIIIKKYIKVKFIPLKM